MHLSNSIIDRFSFVFRASKEEMIQRADANNDNHGPRVPDGSPVNATENKGFSFSRLH